MEFIGWMYDIAREQSPREPVLREMLDRSLTAGYGAVGLYLEHRFAYDSAPWAADEGCVTPDLVRRLQSDYRPRGLRLIPFINTLGHMEGFLRAEGGRHLAEGSRFGTEQLCPSNPDCAPFVRGLIDDVINTFDDDWLHLGGDEPWQLGSCPKCTARSAEIGKAGLYGEWYRPLCEYALQRGKRPGLWADAVLEHPDALKYLPRETLLFDWQYDQRPQSTTSRLRAAGFEVVCCPAVHSFDSGWCFLDATQRNIVEHAEDARALGGKGVLVTSWELCYFTQYASIFPLILAAGEVLSRNVDWETALATHGGPNYARVAQLLGVDLPAASEFLKPGTWRLLRDRLIMRQNPFELWRDWRKDACGEPGNRILQICDSASRLLPETHALQWAVSLHRIAVEFVNRIEFAAQAYSRLDWPESVSHLENAQRVLRGLGPITEDAEAVGGSPVDRQRLNVLLGKVDRAIARVTRVSQDALERRDTDGAIGYRPSFETLVHDHWLPRDQAAWRTGDRK